MIKAFFLRCASPDFLDRLSRNMSLKSQVRSSEATSDAVLSNVLKPSQSTPYCCCVQWCDMWVICLLCHKIALGDIVWTDHSFVEIFMVLLSRDHSIRKQMAKHGYSWAILKAILGKMFSHRAAKACNILIFYNIYYLMFTYIYNKSSWMLLK